MEFIEQLILLLDIKVAITVFVLMLSVHSLYRKYHQPPGPWGIPVVGYLPLVWKKDFVQLVTELGKKYGNVFSLTFGCQVIIILNDYEAIKEAFVKQGKIFNGRPSGLKLFPGKTEKGLLIDDGESWQQHRRLIISMLREMGMGNRNIEPKIQEEIAQCINELKSFNGEAMDPKSILEVSILNVISTMIFGKRFHYKDEKLKHMMFLSEEVGKMASMFKLRAILEIIMWIPYLDKLLGLKRIQDIRKEFEEFNYSMIDDHQKGPTKNHESSYIGTYLNHRNDLIEKHGDEGHFDISYLEGNLGPLFTAGRETTSATLRWGLLYMIANPDVQSKVQAEIDRVIGFERQPSMKDRSQMPYTEATLMEIHRLGSVVPLSIVHSNLEEATLFGHQIPKRSIIIPNLWAVHHDETFWEDVKSFKPERFLNANGSLQKNERVIPFSIGKRACLAESLARMEVFLYFTSLFQNFTFCNDANGEDISLDFEHSIIRSPCPFKVRAIHRQTVRM